MKYLLCLALACPAWYIFFPEKPLPPAQVTVFRNATVIDGNGGTPATHTDIRVENGVIVGVGRSLDTTGARIVDMTGKTIMPELISTHTHIGTLKGTQTNGQNYTRDNILPQLKKYESFGVGNILVMGSDRPMLFASGLRDSCTGGLLPGALLHTAGYGFGVPDNAPPAAAGLDKVFRPATAAEVPAMMDEVARLHPDVIKMWVDDFGGRFRKMDPEVYTMVIRQAHAHGLRVASHLYYLADARKLVAAGLDIIAHSVRDSVIDDALLREMKKRHVLYIPTLSLDEFAYIYARKPEWINDAFFKASLEPGVYEMITSPKYQEDIKNSPDYQRNRKAFEIALQNVKRVYDAGIEVCLGTDSGATPLRAQGFSEHLELELLVQSGLTPLQAITVGTRNAARLLKIDNRYGTLQKGRSASFIILQKDPVQDIRNSRSIEAVYRSGVLVSKGPLAQ